MKELDAFLLERLQKKNKNPIETLADRREPFPSSKGFGVVPLEAHEERALYKILVQNQTNKNTLEEDIKVLKRITEEVKAIDGQAILLHGERIKKVQLLLKSYREGAFTAWLLETYKNRQTPYNFLQYYEFYQSLTETLREKIVQMPKQAVYTLASRRGEFASKKALVENCYQEPKEALLQKIRLQFPLPQKDARKQKAASTLASLLKKAVNLAEENQFSVKECEILRALLKKLQNVLR